jgi:glycosyltransferase involved in cell wall biosynthesis
MTKAERVKIRNERIRQRILNAQVVANATTTTTTAIIFPIPKGKLTLEICIHCFRYQKRLTWLLSSILQQEGNIPNIIINISHTADDGTPTTEQVCKFFREKGLNIKETILAKEEVHNRGRARNRQTQESQADYLLYVDCDMVYDKDFMADLHKQLKTNLKDETKVMGADRISLKEDFCINYLEKEDKIEYPSVISNVAGIVSTFPVKWVTGKDTCPGNFQLASMKAIKAKGGGYGGRNNDFWRNTKSDRAMRCRMGGRIGINAKKQWHLNHDRGGPEAQR